jgi:hypothetical protein
MNNQRLPCPFEGRYSIPFSNCKSRFGLMASGYMSNTIPVAFKKNLKTDEINPGTKSLKRSREIEFRLRNKAGNRAKSHVSPFFALRSHSVSPHLLLLGVCNLCNKIQKLAKDK